MSLSTPASSRVSCCHLPGTSDSRRYQTKRQRSQSFVGRSVMTENPGPLGYCLFMRSWPFSCLRTTKIMDNKIDSAEVLGSRPCYHCLGYVLLTLQFASSKQPGGRGVVRLSWGSKWCCAPWLLRGGGGGGRMRVLIQQILCEDGRTALEMMEPITNTCTFLLGAVRDVKSQGGRTAASWSVGLYPRRRDRCNRYLCLGLGMTRKETSNMVHSLIPLGAFTPVNWGHTRSRAETQFEPGVSLSRV